MADYEFTDHTADVGLIAYGSTREDVFINAAKGMFSLIIDPLDVGNSHQEEISLYAEDYEELLVTWLNELLYLLEAENLVFSIYKITSLSHDSLNATVFGEKIDLSRHTIKTQVKAATYHQIKMKKEGDGYSARVILDV